MDLHLCPGSRFLTGVFACLSFPQMAPACPASLGACVLGVMMGYSIPEDLIILGGLSPDGLLGVLPNLTIDDNFVAYIARQDARGIIVPSGQSISGELNWGQIRLYQVSYLWDVAKAICEHTGVNFEELCEAARSNASGPGLPSSSPSPFTPKRPRTPANPSTPPAASASSMSTPPPLSSLSPTPSTGTSSSGDSSTRKSARTRKPKRHDDDDHLDDAHKSAPWEQSKRSTQFPTPLLDKHSL